jgi:phage gp46-like protein
MTDARLDLGPNGADLVLDGDDLATDEGLTTALVVSILSDGRSDAERRALPNHEEIRGWWADNVRDRFGSRLWTLEREKRTTDTLERARELGEDALAWLVEDQIASRVSVEASYDDFGRLRLEANVERGTSKLFAHLWAGTQAVKVGIHQAVSAVPAPPTIPDQNVVVFLLDDGGAELFDWSELDAPTDPYALTPRLHEMQGRGVTFLRGYATPICGPTRACLHTGRHGFRTGLAANLDGAGSAGFGLGEYGGFPTLETGMIARALRLGRDGTDDQSLGAAAFTYVSFWGGKGHIYSDAGRETWPVQHGWGRNIGCQPNASSLENWPYGQAEPNDPGDPGYVPLAPNSGHFHFREISAAFAGVPVVTTYGAAGTWPAGGPYKAWDTTTTPKAAWDAYKVARDLILRINGSTQPVFAVVCMNPPHAPFEVPPFTFPDNVGVGATGLDLPLISDATRHTMESLNGGAGGPGFIPTDPVRTRAVYRANMEAFDTLVGWINDRIDPAKLARTVFILSGDNGTVPEAVPPPYDPGHSKRTIFEQGQRVPFLVWGSSDVIAQPGRTCDHLVHTVDIFSTVLEITGCDPDRWNPGGALKIDGRSFLPVLRDPEATPARDFIYAEIFAPIGARRDGDPGGTPPIPVIPPNQWLRSFNDGTDKIIQNPQGASPPFRFFRITSEVQPGSGRRGYYERPEDDLYPQAIDGLHPDVADRFETLLGRLIDFVES